MEVRDDLFAAARGFLNDLQQVCEDQIVDPNLRIHAALAAIGAVSGDLANTA
ncbi:hypothetical protein [Planomonospora venezuelensis]|uniref:Uncharacterized protein n=1 Tax=Planomonospora venezuelensis TaxID=1999 RepID=A0A841D170_PLAVE|nr:hypothetical protein [Planomonospora venezuelensis]MBB5962148.1 hypothetical protein [Planomonospora venezuelensis]GIN00912.1 hypothetical protein Pve01_25700 [Planomonospora venezuelensis]